MIARGNPISSSLNSSHWASVRSLSGIERSACSRWRGDIPCGPFMSTLSHRSASNPRLARCSALCSSHRTPHAKAWGSKPDCDIRVGQETRVLAREPSPGDRPRGLGVWRLALQASTRIGGTCQQHPCRLFDLAHHPTHLEAPQGAPRPCFRLVTDITSRLVVLPRLWHILCVGPERAPQAAQCKPTFGYLLRKLR